MASEPPTPDTFGRDEGRHVFGRAAELYAARPGYPDRVYDILRDRCQLGRSSRVLEIGAGTGQATKRLVTLSAHVVAVEPNDALAGRLRAELTTAQGLEVIEATFEDAELPTSSFDLVAAATSFHWLDPAQAFPKVALVLKGGGWLALWWNVFGDPDQPNPFHDATQPLLENLAVGPGRGLYALDVAARISDLSNNGFLDVEHEAVRWTLDLDATQARQLYATYSNIARLPDAQRVAILDEIQRIAEQDFGGRVERRMVTPIYTAHL